MRSRTPPISRGGGGNTPTPPSVRHCVELYLSSSVATSGTINFVYERGFLCPSSHTSFVLRPHSSDPCTGGGGYAYGGAVEASWNVMAHAQKPDFVFRRNGRVHLNRWGSQFNWLLGSRGVRINGSNAGYTMFRGSVKSTGYPLLTSFPFTSPPVRHRVPSHFNWSLHPSP